MKKLMILLAICMVITMIPLSVAGDGDVSSKPWDYVAGVDYVDGEVIILTDYYVDPSVYSSEGSFTFHGVEMTELNPLFSASSEEEIEAHIERSGNTFSYVATLDSSVSVQSAVNTLCESDGILVAEPNYIIEQEPMTEEQIAARTSAVESWTYEYLELETVRGYGFTGSSDIVVAVLDVGFVPHYDLSNNMDWEHAYDVIDGDNDISPEFELYKNHGMVIAGIIGADNDDDFISGICSSVSILPIKVHTNNGTTVSKVLQGVEYAIANDADIINYSSGMSDTHYAMSIRQRVSSANVIFVTASGNDNVDMSENPGSGGANHDDPLWIIVGAMNEDETKRASSNYSSIYCDMFAPGSNLTSLGYSYDSEGNLVSELLTDRGGTSYAAPHVAAACALIMSHATHLTPLEVKELLMDTVKPLDGFENYCVSGGTLSITNAIEYLYTCNRGAYTKGDVTGDGYVNMFDYQLIKSAYVGQITLTDEQFDAADIMCDGTIDVFDYSLTKQFVFMQGYFIP